MAIMLKKVILLIVALGVVAMLAGTVPAALEQTTGLTFVGKIEEISIKTTMTPVGGMEKFLAIKLDSKPKMDFRVPIKDAAHYGLIDTDHLSAVLTPGKIKGLGWKVRLTCNKQSTMNDPNYLVTNLQRLD
jgi:hypothetical protein